MQRLYMLLCLGSALTYWYAYGYSPAPTQIYWVYTALVFMFAVGGFTAHTPIALLLGKRDRALWELTFLIGLYFSAFYVVSFWEHFPGTTTRYGLFEIINILVAMNFFVLARACDSTTVLRGLSWLAIALVGLTIVQLMLDDTVTRYGHGQQLMLSLPAAYLLGRRWLVTFGLLVMLASQHRAPLAGAMLAVAVAAFWGRPWSARRTWFSLAASVTLFAIGIGVALVLAEDTHATLARLLYEEEGVTRVFITGRSLGLLQEHFPVGIGYMNFLMLTGYEIDHTIITRFGDEVVGVNLHNSYMTWMLEGGLLVTVVVLYILYRAWVRVRVALDDDRNMGVLFVAWATALLFLGAFHQLHSTMQFWGTLGFIFGFNGARGRLSHPALSSEVRGARSSP